MLRLNDEIKSCVKYIPAFAGSISYGYVEYARV